ncbi:MAG: hypothetical protein BMS9Abin36_1217 [Gammaproteobacteria bacterium]|nr:MAG: hypothetical protein BMS9Abin36_1217 [Gammaproteobacteria bacterium]
MLNFNLENYKSGIARRLIIYVVLFSSFITLLATAMQLYRDYDNDVNLIEDQLLQVQKVHLKTLTATLWASDTKELKTHLEGVSRIRDMQFLEVRDREKVWVSVGTPQSENVMSRQYPMIYTHRGRNIEIGTLTIVASLTGVYQRLIDKVWVILISNSIKTFLVAGFILFIFHTLITRHLLRIADFARTLDINSLGRQLVLNRKGQRKQKMDELDLVVNAINQMQVNIKQSLSALEQSEKHFQVLARVAPVGIFNTDAQGNCIYTNERWRELAGMSEAEALGEGWARALHTEDRERVFSEWHQAAADNIPFHCECRFQRPDGSVTWLLTLAEPELDAGGQVLGYVGTITDITKLKQAEEALQESERYNRMLFEQSSIGLALCRMNGELVDINPAYAQIIGRSMDETLELTYWDITPKKKYAEDEQRQLEGLNTTGRYGPYEKEYIHKDGHLVPVRLQGLLLEKDGEQMIWSTVEDITERKQQEELLRRSQKMDALGKLTGGVAHDYNNLLGIIMGYAGLLEDMLSDRPNLANYAHEIQHAGERGARLTQKLLAFSRQKSSAAERLDINTLLQDEQHMLEKTLTARIKLVYDLAEDLWPVWLDGGDLEDAIVNMSINAMHAMETGGELTLRTRNEQLNAMDAQLLHLEAGDYVLFSMTDTGCGMDEATKERIFDPFYTSKGEQGTGLGLSQVYGFVERSGGAIKVYSEPEHGTRFALYFPRSHQTVTETPTPAPSATNNLRGSETLLVVDDEQAMVELAHDILTAQGYRVLTANDGEQALAILEKEAVDLIVSDVIMPKLDGYQLAAQVQQRYPRIKLQMVSGFADDRHNHMTDDALHQNMLYKPYASNTLLVRIRYLLDEGNANTNSIDTLAGCTILVMDDEEDVRELFTLNLERLGCKVIPASNGDEAIALYRQALESDAPIDVVIMDLTIPGGMGGKELADTIRTMDPNARMIIASGHSDSPEMTQYQDYGFCGALEKDFDREKIKQVLEQVLSSS